MTIEEKILLSLLIYGKLHSQLSIYDLTNDLDITNFGQIRVDLLRILSRQVLAQEFCLGCLSSTGQMSLEVVSDCPRCTPDQRVDGRQTLYWMHFIYGLDTEGTERRALHQSLYQEEIIK